MTNQRNQFKNANTALRGNRSRTVRTVIPRACAKAVAGHLGKQVLAELAGEYKATLPGLWLDRAFADAEAVAWSTPYPLLFLPELAREKVQNARRWSERQQQILQARAPIVANPAN